MSKLKLSIENFQSISHGQLEFETGLNFLVGQSNSGKSAIFRAIKACLSNPSGSQRFIKYGEKQASVTLEYNENEITWKRTPKESSYEINGETYVKTGASSALKILGDSIGFVKDENTDIIMNIEEELHLPFPFGISKADLFKLYENVFCVSDSAIILKSAKDREEEIKDKMVSLEGDLGKNSLKLNELLKFKEEIDLNTLVNYRDSLVQKRDRTLLLMDGLPIIKKALMASTLDFTLMDFEVTNKLGVYRDKVDCLITLKTCKALHKVGKSLSELSCCTKPKMQEYSNLCTLSKDLHKLNALEEVKFNDSNFINKLSDYNTLAGLKREAKRIKELDSLKLPEIEVHSKVEKYLEAREFLKSVKEIKNSVKLKKAELEKINEKIESIKEDLSKYKVCPLCHREL